MATERLKAAQRREGKGNAVPGPVGTSQASGLSEGRGRWGRASWKKGFHFGQCRWDQKAE